MKQNIWLDGMMGLVVGDALGVPVQFMSRKEIKNRKCGPVVSMEGDGTYNMPAGTWSDDSSMALATLASIIDNWNVDANNIMQRFVDWEYKGEYTPFGEAFDEGFTCSTAIERYCITQDAGNCGCKGEYSNGNGALMRILPVCLYYYNQEKKGLVNIDEIISGIDAVSGLTHNHERSKMCCGFYYFLVKNILSGMEKEEPISLNELLESGITDAASYYKSFISKLTELSYLGRIMEYETFIDLPESSIKSSGYVIDSLEAAIWCLSNSDSYKECMLKAVNLGEDTDTVAAIAGGLAGLYYGYDNIPAEWLKVIKRREWIEGMCKSAGILLK